MSNITSPSGQSIFGSSSVFGQGINSTSNLASFGSPIGGLKTGGTSNNCFGKNIGSNSFFGATASAVSGGGSTASFGASSGTSLTSTFPSFGGHQNKTLVSGTTGFCFGNQCTGSRRAAYSVTKNIEKENMLSLSAMPVYSGKSHEELRFEDYNVGDRGGIAKRFSSFSTFATQTSSNPFSAQATSSLLSPQTSPGFISTQTATNSNSPQTSFAFSPQTSLGPFTNQATPNLTSQTSTNPFASVSTLGPQPSFQPFQPQTSSNWFSTQTSSNSLFPLQTSPSIFSTQTTSNPHPPQTSSIFSPQSSFGPFSNHTAPSFLTPPNPFNGFSTQNTSSILSPQTSPSIFSTQTTSNPNPPQTSSIFSPQTSFSPFYNQTSPSLLTTPQTTSNSFSTQTTSSLVLPQTSGLFSTQTTSNTNPPQTSSAFSNQTGPSFYPPQPSSNGFSSTTSFGPFSNQTSQKLNFPQIPATTFAHTSSNLFPSMISPPIFSPHPTNNTNAFVQVPCTNTPWQSAQTVPTTSLQPSTAVGPSTSSQGPAPQSTAVSQPVININPFGEFPVMNRLSTSQPGSTISVQYGISSMPVHDKPSAPVRFTSSLTSRHLSHQRMRLPSRKYDSKSDSPKVPFFSTDDESPVRASTLVPRENPRAFVAHSAELWHHKSETQEVSPGVSSENNTNKDPNNVVNINPSAYEPDCHEAKISKEMDEIEALIPQLSIPDYYTKPSIEQFAEKEMEEPGFCSRVKDFEIGRYGYGNIKFLGETDVRKLCLDSLVEFNNREVVVFKDENEKPPVEEGLNKLAQVTLLNIQCVDKKTGKKHVEGLKVEKYKEMLKKKGEEQGAEFISYDPVKGEWKFRVQHF